MRAALTIVFIAIFAQNSQSWAPSARLITRQLTHKPVESTLSASQHVIPEEADVVIIGSGLAGLSCGALLAHCKKKVVVLESHDIPGGAAHSWERRGFHFESGPSLYSGFSTERSPNPLKNIFQIVEEDCDWITYDRWGTVLPNGKKFAAKIGPDEFGNVLQEHGGQGAQEEFNTLMERMKPLSDAAQALTSLALREDAGVVLTLMKYPKEVLMTFSQGQRLNEPFGNVMDEMEIKNEFVRNWLDMLCFLLQGLPARGTLNAVMSYMLADWYRPGVTLDYPKGGSGEIVHALIRAIRKNGSEVCTNAHVSEILVEDGKAVGVQLLNGRTIRAKTAVVSNADPYVTTKLLSGADSAGNLPVAMKEYMEKLTKPLSEGGVEDLRSFIHLHAGIDASGLPEQPSEHFPAQWAVVRSWNVTGGVEAPRNIVLCSMPSLIDPMMAPAGKHVIHAYTPATEPYEWWEGMDRKSPKYIEKKAEAEEFLWKAIEEYVPDARKRAVPGTVQIGTPLTHERFLRRTRGSYGPRIDVGKGQTLPGHTTPLQNFYLCGDYTFPSIGVPATAASGAITANSILSVWDHLKMLDKIKLPDK